MTLTNAPSPESLSSIQFFWFVFLVNVKCVVIVAKKVTYRWYLCDKRFWSLDS